METSNNTILLLGDPGQGKTTFLLSFPKPRILFPVLERGWVTLNGMKKEQFYDPNWPPTWRKIISSVDLMRELNHAEADLKANPDAFHTLGLDTLTAYARMHLAFLETLGIKNKMDMYGQLLTHLTQVLIKAHSLPCNVVWTGHVSADTGNLDIPGKSVNIFQGSVIDCILVTLTEGNKRVIATTAYERSKQLRCKGKNLPATIPLTNFKEVAPIMEWVKK